MGIKVTITLPDTTTIRNSDKETVAVIEWSKMPAHILEAGAPVAFKTMLLNTYNGGGAAMNKTERKAKAEKKLNAWYSGSLNVIERGESENALLRDALEARLCAALKVDSVTPAQFRKFMVDSIVAVGGKAPETGKVVPVDEVVAARAKLGKVDLAEYTATLLAEGEAIAATRASAMATIDVTGIAV